jgi:hypothetical protein
MHRLSHYEDYIQLELPVNKNAIDLESLNWMPYNPRKNINRFGCSITSLDGNDSGIPDLDSLTEYNRLHGTKYTEKDFSKPTVHATPFLDFLNTFTVGRSHYLKLNPGGFFPWHRDNDPTTFRIIYTIQNCSNHSMIWLEDDKILPLENHSWYYINTRKKHALFSFDGSIMAVFNVVFNTTTYNLLQNSMMIK